MSNRKVSPSPGMTSRCCASATSLSRKVFEVHGALLGGTYDTAVETVASYNLERGYKDVKMRSVEQYDSCGGEILAHLAALSLIRPPKGEVRRRIVRRPMLSY